MRRAVIPLTLTFVAAFFISCQDGVVANEDSSAGTTERSAVLDVPQNAFIKTKKAPQLSSSTRQQLAQVRRATARYQDVRKAEADGYLQASPFVPEMGFHYVNPGLFDEQISISQPEALVYDANDPERESRNLVAVEYIIPDPQEDKAQGDLPTPFSGQTADSWHYEDQIGAWTLHAWVWLDNPEGVFHPTNPRVTHGAPTP